MNMAKKEAVFPEKERRRIRFLQQTPIENRIFEKKAANAEKQSAGEEVKTRRGAETVLSLDFPIKVPDLSPK